MGKENLDKIMKISRMKIAVSKFEEEEHTMPKRNLLKMVATFVLTIGMTFGLVYAGNVVYEKIWKEPEAYKISQEITEEEKAQCISETEAEEIAKAYLKKIGYTDESIGSIGLYKESLSQENITWFTEVLNRRSPNNINLIQGYNQNNNNSFSNVSSSYFDLKPNNNQLNNNPQNKNFETKLLDVLTNINLTLSYLVMNNKK